MKKFLKDYLTFSRKDRIGALAIAALILIVYLLPQFFSRPSTPFPLSVDSALIKAIDTLQHKQIGTEKISSNARIFDQDQLVETESMSNPELFNFDPNTLSPEGWKRLGLKEKIINTLIHYRDKGGRFKKPEDLKKIWGMPEEFYDRVEAYIKISSQENLPKENKFSSYPVSERSPERKISPIDINLADTSAFIALPGIGSKLATRIVNFRDKLGGFCSVDQIGETYGLPDSTFQLLKPYFLVGGKVRKLNINTATADELKAHPYIRWNLANAIVSYRKQHGNFTSLEELKNIALVTSDWLEKIGPYLAWQ